MAQRSVGGGLLSFGYSVSGFLPVPHTTRSRGESSEAAISRHATAENATQREFHQNFSTFTRK
ncbi:hypothetical protein I8752_23000 [Nostocaceae cyanobacterium CENA369]|uniref:Uncharacterized protein n=1 Tax=Dendronalium phyllosphericum CENA369 TaxID=1725256 RepID=A0A8J7I6J8_9NOST|nr:hypothetical protein [Dendronalium phyllosphericum]MBH8575815.1 hypothetical protein [Dendronalium phyllosphericum CENA369]